MAKTLLRPLKGSTWALRTPAFFACGWRCTDSTSYQSKRVGFRGVVPEPVSPKAQLHTANIRGASWTFGCEPIFRLTRYRSDYPGSPSIQHGFRCTLPSYGG